MKNRQKVLIALFSALVLLTAVTLTGCFGDEEGGEEEETSLDKDNDGMLDEWEITYGLDPNDPNDAHQDPDGDDLDNLEEHGTRTDPNDPDTDDDGAEDGEDVDPLVDSVVVFQFINYTMEDAGDFGSEVDVYFKIRLNDVDFESDIIYYDMDAGNISIDYMIFYDLPDTQSTVDITFSWYDSDLFFDDKLDCSEYGDSCDLNYSLITHSWWGDNLNGTTSGEFDGSYETDEDDVTIVYRIFDSIGHADEIAAILEDAGSENPMEDFNYLVRYVGHCILEEIVDWCLENPQFFVRHGGWGAVVGAGLFILGIAIYLHEEINLGNEDSP